MVVERVDNPGGSGSWKEPLLLSSQAVSDLVGDTAQDIEQLKTDVAVTSSKLSKVSTAQPLFSKEEYFAAWKAEKDVHLIKFRKLAYEVMALENMCHSDIERLNLAVTKVPMAIKCIIPGTGSRKKKPKDPGTCHVFLNDIKIASSEGPGARRHAYVAALQKICMPYLRLVNLDDPSSAELHASVTPFSLDSQRVDTLSQTLNSEKVETNTAKRRREDSTNNEHDSLYYFKKFKPIEDFVIVEPPDSENRPTCILARSASLNHMNVEYDSLPCDDGDFQCILKVEGKVLADVKGLTKPGAKNGAAAEGLKKLRQMCWTVKIKKAIDSDFTITNEEMLSQMGWSGGGVGKDGSGITSVLKKKDFGLDTGSGVTAEFRKRVREVIQNYAASDQEDLVFSHDFSLDQRKAIIGISEELKLKGRSRGKGKERCLCVRRRRTAAQLVSHIRSCGGETAKYKLLPPGENLSA